MALPATDNFNRTNANPAGGNWTSLPGTAIFSGAMQVLSNVLTGNTDTDSASYWNADTFGNDQYTQAIITTAVSGYGYAFCRCSSSIETAYYLRIYNKDTLGLRKIVSGTITTIGSPVTQAISNGATIKFVVTGTNLEAFYNGTSKITGSDSSIASGSAGLGTYSTTTTWDDWEGGNVSTSISNIQGVSSGSMLFSGCNLQDIASFRSRLIQGILSGEIRVVGSSPDNIYTNNQSIQQIIQGITSGTQIFTGLSPRDIYRATGYTIQGITGGDLKITGLDLCNGYSGVAVGGKSAALKLGLFSGADVWSTPLQNYIGKFKDFEVRPKQEVEVDLSQAVADLELLKLQVQELEQSLGGVLGKSEKLTARREIRAQEKKINQLKHEYLMAEDEEIILLLNI